MWLRTEVFTHGQLYVASSRVGDPSKLKYAVMSEKDGKPKKVNNVVYKEVLISN